MNRDSEIVLVIGASGLVGSKFVELSRNRLNLLTPHHKTLDIVNKALVYKMFRKHRPRVVVNFATIINIDQTEKERGDRSGKVWQTNVVGVTNLVEACKAEGTFLIQLSSDAVFPGSQEYPGPYHEHSLPSLDGKGINWYGYTKVAAEREAKKLGKRAAILRISHPFGNTRSKKDLIIKTIDEIKSGQKLFNDQILTPTFIDDLTRAIWVITEKELPGIFHVSSTNLVSRFVFGQSVAKKLKIKKRLISGSMKGFLRQRGHATRTRLGGLETSFTQQILGISFHSWQEALNELYY